MKKQQKLNENFEDQKIIYNFLLLGGGGWGRNLKKFPMWWKHHCLYLLEEKMKFIVSY